MLHLQYEPASTVQAQNQVLELSIIYVNWNSLDYLRQSITSVYRHTRRIRFEIIVVDNASPEGGVESLLYSFPEIRIITSDMNRGFARANNVGFKHSAGRQVLFLNPDTLLESAAIEHMLERLKMLPQAGIVGCKLLNSDRSVQLSSIQTYPTILNQALDAEYLRLRWPHCPLWRIAPLFKDDVKVLEVEVIPGACMLLRREVFERVGMFSEDYFMYAEDLDLNYKLKAAGFKNYYLGDTSIIHHGGCSSSRQNVNHWATVMKHRAMVMLFRKKRGTLYAFGYRAAMGVVATARLSLLGVLFPIGKMVWDRKSMECAAAKWKSVLKWAVGRQNCAA